ncbi:heavy metal transport/detoxification protein [Cryobacterium zongtaii]|uniref:Heavy metal transport/detoxification protein n=1 Tax=Cryobacterium zongtaii TaxID=1259217 RepID=A0A2S3ZK08_9MICO|nr:heavy metal-associated domain-containing protein [Cryobacterium zongtaii]POH68377.1 heavy metal transport/detoxification protein [Cryobacterium zongtaii]
MTTITSPGTHTILRADGFSCPSCVAKIEKLIGRLPGVTGVAVFFSSARIEIDHDPAVVSTDALIAAVGKAGYPARLAAF